MDRTELLARIKTKQAELETIKAYLKTKFFGIDEQIDKILEYIKAWYITPEIINRPLIINLWGLTGVGKTSLIRELVNQLKFTNKFVEIQMGDDTTTSMYRNNNVCSILKQSAIGEREPGIILLDEFQRFKTIDMHGEDLKDQKFQDIWMLLSDGKFAKDYSLFERMMDFAEYNLIDYDEEKSDDDEESATIEVEVDGVKKTLVAGSAKKKKKKKMVAFEDRKLSKWQIRSLKSMLGNYITTDELKNLTIGDTEELIRDYLDSEESGAIDYSKLLIFVSGNLDEAYNMSDDVEDCDTDADIFYEKTKLISINNIKRALSARFKPEQIARLGNNHIIYPSLNKTAYENIIDVSCRSYIRDANEISDIKFNIKPSVIEEIYNNAVYPAQGTRPVFSSIHKMFASPLTNGIFWGLVNDSKELDINISSEKSAIIFSEGNSSTEVPIDFDIRDNKKKYSDDFTALLAVHESGHALAYSLLFKYAPKQIKINLASFNGGFNQLALKTPNKESLFNQMCVLLAGTAAEEVIFGANLRSAGGESDLFQATNLAASTIRKLGLTDEFSSYIMVTDKAVYNENVKGSDANVDAMVKDAKMRTLELLRNNMDILVECSRLLQDKKEISSTEFIERFGERLGITSTIAFGNYDVFGDYHKLLNSK